MYNGENELMNGLASGNERHESLTDAEAKAFCDKVLSKCREIAESKGAPSGNNAAKSDIAALVSAAARIRNCLRETVFGQDNAIEAFVTGYFQAEMLSLTESDRERPKATFLFAGPSGVGKTLLAVTAARALGMEPKIFDMSEYADKESALEFCGSDAVYKDSKSGNFTSYVSENPKSFIIIDEIEKAHISIIHLFLQILDAGRIRDSKTDKVISLKDAIFVFTTNAGRELYENGEEGPLSLVPRKVVLNALRRDVNPQTDAPYFPASICSRFASGNVVMFDHVGAHDLCRVAEKELLRHARNFGAVSGIGFEIDEQVFSALLFSEGVSADARTVRSRAEAFFNRELYELLRLLSAKKGEMALEGLSEVKIGVDLTRASDEARELFLPERKPEALVFAKKRVSDACKRAADCVKVCGCSDLENAVEEIKRRLPDFIIVDVMLGASKKKSEILNVEDIDGAGRDFLRFLRENKPDIPVYLLETADAELKEEEKISFLRQGVQGTLSLADTDEFKKRIRSAALSVYRRAGMKKLGRANRLITFETSQSLSDDGKTAFIYLFDLATTVAIDAHDSQNILSSLSTPNTRFSDVIGAEDAKRELAYFVEYLKKPQKYIGTGVKAPNGVLLYGPSGTGKTMLAKAMAAEAGVTFIAVSGNTFLKKYQGEGAAAVHSIFGTARKYAPAILFIDEIDAIAKERTGSDTGGSEATLTAILTEMDGFDKDPSKPVFVLAATNFNVKLGESRRLDSALVRRFDRRVYIGLPGRDDRMRFLKTKTQNSPAFAISKEGMKNIADRATGMSLAELDSVLELALRSAIREGSTVVTDAILEEAFELFNGGEAKSWDASQLERVARHEAGHALVCFESGEMPSYLTVVPRSITGGYMQRSEREGAVLYTKDEFLARIRTCLGGRAAEVVCYGERGGISTGAGADLKAATEMARDMVCTYGMDSEFGLAVIEGEERATGAMASEIHSFVNRILNDQMNEAKRIIVENRERFDALVKRLVSQNHLSGREIEEILGEATETRWN